MKYLYKLCHQSSLRHYRHLFFLFLALFPLFMQAQQKVVDGHITDKKGNGIPGVNIAVKNSRQGVVTDQDGKFRIIVPDSVVLSISNVGFANVELQPQKLKRVFGDFLVSLEVESIDSDGDGILDSFDREPDIFNEFKTFPSKYPAPSGKYTVVGDTLLKRRYRDIGSLDSLLGTVLTRMGYDERGYYFMPKGFALVTQMEQFNDDGTSKPVPQRWETTVKAELNGFWNHISNLVNAPEGNFRIIAFLVTDANISSSGIAPKQSEMSAWVFNGSNKLPSLLKKLPVTQDHSLTVLVYQYKKTSGVAPVLTMPGSLTAKQHLSKAGILSYLP